ncbi:MAG: sigma-70 family RNA polymerase sigma factor [Rubrivivax sp.]|nr:sigma-70 family RNA polymerase sigma factor [Rubrivivax sp.]
MRHDPTVLPSPVPSLTAERPVRPGLAALAPAGGHRPDLGESYAGLRRSLLGFLRKHTGDPQVAEDLLHDVMVKALQAEEKGTGSPRHLAGWLYAVARNAAMDHHRSRRPAEELPEDLAAPEGTGEDETAAELANCLRPLAERLPATYRDTLIAAEFDHLALAEVARRQGLTLSAVKTRASRGRRLLKEELVACCRIALSAQGEVLDYDTRSASGCAAGGCGCSGGSRRR